MRHIAILSLLVTCLVGCETVVRTTAGGKTSVWHVDDDPNAYQRSEQELREFTREHPDDAKGWWQLGDFLERGRRFQAAVGAYENMQAAIEKESKKDGVTYVGGYYLLGKNLARLKQWEKAIFCLQKVLEAQPDDSRVFMRSEFRESHYLLGAIYFEHRMYGIAEKHLLTFKELSGDGHRADAMLIGIEDELRPEARFRPSAQPDAPRASDPPPEGS